MEGTISRVRFPFEGSTSEISISTNSVFIIDNSMWARSGIIIDRDIRGKFGAPLSKIGTLPGKLILFNPFFKWSCKKPFTCIDITKSLDDMALTSQLGSNGSGAPRSTHSDANK